jgi:hypothetical protein
MFYLISDLGRLFKVDVHSKIMQPNQLPLINIHTDIVQSWDIPDFLTPTDSRFYWTHFKTNDGKIFWLCSNSLYLLYGDINHPNKLHQAATRVKYFELVNQAAVCMMVDGSIKLTVPKQRTGSDAFTVNIVSHGVVSLLVTPTLKCVWFKKNDGRFYIKGILISEETTPATVVSFSSGLDEIKTANVKYISDLLLAAVTDMQADLNALADDTRAMASAAQR